MIYPTTFEKYKCDSKSLKSFFEDEKAGADSTSNLGRLKALLRERIMDGMDRSLADYRTWAAVDLAYDAPFHQLTPTIVRALTSGRYNQEEFDAAIKGWGLTENQLFCCTTENGKEVKKPNWETITTTLIPFVRAYLTVRLAAIYNDRNLTPLLKYEPLYSTTKDKLRCQLITALVQRICTTMGYSTVLQRMIMNPLLYSVGLMFPMEPWFKEVQEDENGNNVVVKQGIRYALPHVTRTFYDLEYPLASLNTDTGVTFAGYWTIQRYASIANNPLFWNRDKISCGYNWFYPDTNVYTYFKQIAPCQMDLPKGCYNNRMTDREASAVYYTMEGDQDKAVFVTMLFMKLIPKEWGMGEYPHPVWFRFFVASDDTVIHCEPYSYAPVRVAQYDPDQNRAKNSSLALEIVPFQDMGSNIITQLALTMRKNLTSIMFYDRNLNVGNQIEEYTKRSNWAYRGIATIAYDSSRQRMSNTSPTPSQAFHDINFGQHDTTQQFSAINTVIALLERCLVISPQEIGASASHQQSKAEVVIINSNTSNRVAYTASFFDETIEAWKSQLYDALIAYAPEDFVAEVVLDNPEWVKVAQEMGFEVETTDDSRRVVIRGKKEHLKLEGFASTRDGPDRGNDKESATAMFQAIQSINQNPMVAQIADPESILEATTEAAKMAGAPDDFKIRTKREAVVTQQVADKVTEASQQIMAQVNETVTKPAAEAVHNVEQITQQTQQQVAQLSRVVERMQSILHASQTAPPLVPPTSMDGAPPPNEPPIAPPAA